MQFTTTVKLVLADNPAEGLRNVRVALFDKDRFTRDDTLGSATTDEQGEARIQFTSEQFVDVDDRLVGEFPDQYAIVYDAEDQEVLSTRAEVVENTARKRITIPVGRDVALRHRLIQE